MLEFMNVVTLRAVFAAQKSGHLPGYLGSTIRGIMGHCFREFVCHTPDARCIDCVKQYNCSYVHSFSNTGGKGGAINPFVLYPHTQDKTEWRSGDECKFDITLFGYAAEQPQIYMDALLGMAKKGWGSGRIPFELKWVTDSDTGRLLYADGTIWMRNLTPHAMRIHEGNARAAFISFRTPVRIISGGELFSDLPFHVLMRFLAGRFSLVTQVCTDFVMELELEEMLKMAKQITTISQEWRNVDFTRYSMNQKNHKLELPARIGWALYEGNLTPFVPYLEAGRYLQVGKNTTIGFGNYDVYYDGEVSDDRR